MHVPPPTSPQRSLGQAEHATWSHVDPSSHDHSGTRTHHCSRVTTLLRYTASPRALASLAQTLFLRDVPNRAQYRVGDRDRGKSSSNWKTPCAIPPICGGSRRYRSVPAGG